MPGQHKHPPIAFRPPEQVRADLVAYAERCGQPVNAVVTAAVAAFLAAGGTTAVVALPPAEVALPPASGDGGTTAVPRKRRAAAKPEPAGATVQAQEPAPFPAPGRYPCCKHCKREHWGHSDPCAQGCQAA